MLHSTDSIAEPSRWRIGNITRHDEVTPTEPCAALFVEVEMALEVRGMPRTIHRRDTFAEAEVIRMLGPSGSFH